MSDWFETEEKREIVISSRIRLARNIKGIPFPSQMTPEQFKTVNNLVRNAIFMSEEPIVKKLKYICMDDVPKIERYAMVERHIISKNFASNYNNRAIIISNDESICIMLGEEDHIRVQVLLAGMQLDKAYEIADEIDNILCKNLNIAFDNRIGFLTECPTNIGTGLRASVMLHLPLMEKEIGMKKLTNLITEFGFAVRGMYGEGTEAMASLYQISNQVTLGMSEKTEIGNIKVIANQFIKEEQENRNKYNMLQLEDRCMRSYGILKNARILTSNELLSRFSDIQLGSCLNLLKCNVSPIELLVKGQPNMLMRKFGNLSPDDRDIERAKMIRELL